MLKTKPKAPEHLSVEAKKLWRSTCENYSIDSQAAMILQVGLEALDRREQARREIASGGATMLDRWGQLKPSPWIGIERDAAGTLMKAFRLLGMDLSQASGGKH